ncbi:MAG: hypothetical protein GX882_03635 [Methanomicrobiales archaeon]|nr:hypothetical protein [Methanomicrobiales archaeon]
MKHNLSLAGAALISGCIIVGGILIGALTFSVEIPFAPYIMMILTALIVFGAAMLILSRRIGSGPSL